MKIFFHSAGIFLLATFLAGCGKGSDDQSNSLQAAAESEGDEGDSGDASSVYKFEGNFEKDNLEQCQSNAYAQTCKEWAAYNWLEDSPNNSLLEYCYNYEKETDWASKCLSDFPTFATPANTAFVYIPSIQRYGDTYSFGMLRGNHVIPHNSFDDRNANFGMSPTLVPSFVSEIAWVDCENREVNIVERRKVQGDINLANSGAKYFSEFGDVRGRKVIQRYALVKNSLDPDGNEMGEPEQPWQDLLVKMCGRQVTDYGLTQNVTWTRYKMPDGLQADIETDFTTLVVDGSKRRFWFKVINYDPRESRTESTVKISGYRWSRIEIDCANNTSRLLADRTAFNPKNWRYNGDITPIIEKTFQFSFRYPPNGGVSICDVE